MDPPVSAIRRATHASHSGSTTLAPNRNTFGILQYFFRSIVGIEYWNTSGMLQFHVSNFVELQDHVIAYPELHTAVAADTRGTKADKPW